MLNKHGWGLKEMLILSGVLILFLIVAIYYIYALYQEMGTEMSSSYYYSLENDLENNAEVFLQDYYDGTLDSEGLTITRSILRSYDLDVSLIDTNGNACSGYVIASRTHGEDTIDAYISCPDYTTAGYEQWRSE